VFSDLASGSYTIHVKDANGCEKTAVVTIEQTSLVVLSTEKADVVCNGGNTGSITASASGGVAPYMFSINAGAFSSNNIFSGLAAGSYTIHVKDANGCEKTAVVTISEPTLVVLSTQKTDVLCNGASTGDITASASGGVAPYMFSINAGAFSSNNIFSGLAAGSYTIHVKDANGCEKTTVVTITEPNLIVLSTQKADVLCNGGNTGSITASATGGVAPYQFSINAGAFSSNNVFTGLAIGSYTIHVKDANGCEKTAVVTISEPTLVVLSTQKTDVLCFGGTNGSITASATGGVAPYQFSINAGAFSSNNVFTGLAVGSYTIHVMDANGCEKTVTVTLSQPPAVSCLLVAPNPLPVCGSTGNTLTATVANAVSYVWSVVGGNGWAITAGQGTPSIIYSAGQDSAQFKLVVINSNGCKDSCHVTVKIGSCVRVKVFCSLTQGFWGNANGVACATGERSAVLVTRLLGAPYGDLVIGKPGRSLTITQDKATCVTLRMPSGGPSVMLPAGDQMFGNNCATTIPINSQGRFNNTLLGQTIALGFNMRLDTDLGGLLIPGATFTTMASKPGIDGKCGTDDDVPDFTSTHTVSISQSVLNALNSIYSSPTIANLFDLANRALGGQSLGGTTLREITGAVGAINEGFDECRFLQVNTISQIGTGSINIDHTRDIVMKAYPNPFANSTTIEFTPKRDGVVNVNVYSLSGARVAELFSGQVKADELKQVIFSGANLPNGIYIYKVSVDDKVYFDKLILQK
jgi:predicted aspartyl protease